MIQLLREFFEEPNGGGSASRAGYLPFIWVITLVHGYVSVKTLKLDPEITLGLAGMLICGKWLQRREEAKNETTPAVPTIAKPSV